jgi:hypothetical protein
MAITLDGTNGITTPDVDSTTSVTTPLVTNAGTLALSATGSNIVTVSTNGSERAQFDASGNLLVGTTSNSGFGGHVFIKNGSNSNTLALVNSATSNPFGPFFQFSGAAPNDTTRYFLSCADTAATRAVIRSNGGIANFSGNNVNLSDERVKTDITPLGSYWDKIKAVEVVTFKYKDQAHDDDNIGVIAQQVESVAPEFVSNDGFGETPEDGVPLKTIYEADLHYATLKALQEAMARIEALEARVAALETNA